MCDVVEKAYGLALSRRAFLGRSALVAGGIAGGMAGGVATDVTRAAGSRSDHREGSRALHAPVRGYRTKLVLLGTAAGPAWWLGSDRAGISSAIAVDDAVYLVDCGDGVGMRYRQTDLAPEPHLRALDRLRGIFLTHLHSDHTIDYPNIPVFGASGYLRTVPEPIQVFGPGNRGALPAFVGTGPEPPVISPQDPTPGTEAMTEYLYKAFATDLNDRIRDGGGVDPHGKLQVHDIPLPPEAGTDPSTPPPSVPPFTVYEDDRVRVTGTLVDHGQVYPSFGFRFDSDDGAVALSGDTAPSDNLVRLAEGADVLVHEVIDRAWVESLFGQPPFPPPVQALIDHLLESHTTIEDVGPVAERAGVRTLVLNHFVPSNNPPQRWRQAKRGFSGRLVVGEDLMQVGVGVRRPGG
jgi:ribonuclease BN (tRNA processing enzyme)